MWISANRYRIASDEEDYEGKNERSWVSHGDVVTDF